MARSLLPFVQNGYYASRNWIPLVKGNGFTTSGGGEQEEVWETASGPIVTFDAVPAPLRQLSVSVEPVQAGSGDPSPDNVRPISGFDSVTVNRTGKNLLDISLANRTLVTTGKYDNNTPRAFDKPYLYVGITMNNYFYNNSINSYSVGEKTVVVNTRQTAYGLGYTLPVKPGTAYTLSYKNKAISTMGIGYYDSDGNYLGFNNINIGTAWTFSTPTNCHNIIVVFRPEQGSEFTYEEPQLELGSTATAYEPYNGNEYTIQLGETVYGGTLDVVNGKMTVDRANIASYNGEILPGFWISDRDVYSAGATPTTGAQVVYELATPFELTLTPQQIATLQGTNNVWSDAGDVTVEYRAQ